MPLLRPILATLALTGAVSAADIPISILEPADRGLALRNVPVAVGLILPAGEATSSESGALLDDAGRAVPFEAEATGWWEPERRNVKWLLLRFRADSDRRYAFKPDGKALRPRGAPMATEREGGIEVNTGALRVLFRQGGGRLIESVDLRGKSMLGEGGIEQFLTLTFSDGATTMKDWRVAVEESTPDRALLRATGRLATSWSEAAATVDARYEFHRGESAVRIWHTLTWRVANPSIGAKEYALVLRTPPGAALVRLGVEGGDPLELPWPGAGALYAHQDKADHFSVEGGGKALREGRRLGGWAALERPDGAGALLVVRDFWQTYPKAFAFDGERLRVELWAGRSAPMGFQFEDIMPPDFYNDAKHWNRFKWVENKGHFVHEFGTNPHFVHTAEGMARTHEFVLHFYDAKSARGLPEAVSLARQPVVARQDPASAMRVPFLGFQVEPVRADYPDMERAVEQIGRMTVGRWPAGHDYGLIRYGMIRWAGTGVSYRWFDGTQYDQQIIPWLLYMRGGDRRWLEEGEATARYAMDVGTNHFNTRNLPTGYPSAASGMPFPWHAAFLSKAPKINFLSYYYHLTGYKRAREVMEEMIAGNKKTAGPAFPQPQPPYRGGHGRELYNMNSFWVNAWEETWDPEIKELAREWLALTLEREYNAALNCFRAPCVYIVPGLVLQYGLGDGEKLKEALLRYLDGCGYPRLQDGGVYMAEAAPAADWALRVTGDRRYAKVAWDIARTLADLVSDHDWSAPEMPVYPDNGHQFHRQFLLPILLGYSNAARLGMKETDAFDLRDTFLSLAPAVGGKARAELCLRPRRDGDLSVRFIFGGEVSDTTPDVAVVVRSADGAQQQRTVIPAKAREAVRESYYPVAWFTPQRGEIVVPGARKGELLRVELEADAKSWTLVLPLADADIIQRVTPGARVFLYNLAGQYYVGTRLFSRSTAEEITVTNEYNKPFTIRDANTGEVLYRYDMRRDYFKTVTVAVGKGRLLQFTMTGRADTRNFTGLSPWFSRTREEWFAPAGE